MSFQGFLAVGFLDLVGGGAVTIGDGENFVGVEIGKGKEACVDGVCGINARAV